MIKLTNAQAAALASPALMNLLADQETAFPYVDAFKISDIITQVQAKQKEMQKAIRQIIEDHKGEIDEESGRVTYPSTELRKQASDKIEELNSIEMEYTGSAIKPKEDWPRLSVAIATILRPILDL